MFRLGVAKCYVVQSMDGKRCGNVRAVQDCKYFQTFGLESKSN